MVPCKSLSGNLLSVSTGAEEHPANAPKSNIIANNSAILFLVIITFPPFESSFLNLLILFLL
jgi:hypothetical protein